MTKALLTPRWLARLVWLLGLISVVSALAPAFRGRVHLVTDVLPDAFPAAATTGALGVGVLLMVLARALRRGKFRAWLVATVLTGVVLVLHLIKGLDVEEAVLSGALLALLVAARPQFRARPDPRSTGRFLVVAVLGPLVATVLGWAWLAIDADGQAPGTTTGARLVQAALGLAGFRGPVDFVDHTDATRAAIALVVLGVVYLVLLVLTAMQPASGPHRLTAPEREQLHALLARWGQVDSLSWFATRDDRSVIYSRSGKAAVSYRVVGAVSLAGGDPLGDPEAWPGAIASWLEEARDFGWTPAVLGASEAGAQAYARAGLDALELGDEAIVDVADFSLEGRRMRVVRQAVSRCQRAGLRVESLRARDLDDAAREEVRECADRWRDGPVERGFSMALGRLLAPEDEDSVLVLCRDEQDRLRALLHLVPWGADGLSLDLMRRARDTENGVVEQMVVGLWQACPALGVRRFSLNFAVFRSVFARGERLGAGPVLRLWRALLLWLSRFWQIESLYRANAKYHPEWLPRFVCFRTAADLGRVGTAALRAEAFLVAPEWCRRLPGRQHPSARDEPRASRVA